MNSRQQQQPGVRLLSWREGDIVMKVSVVLSQDPLIGITELFFQEKHVSFLGCTVRNRMPINMCQKDVSVRFFVFFHL